MRRWFARRAPEPDAPPSEPVRARLEREAAELGPWLQGPFPLGDDLVAGGPWRCDERWRAIEPLLPAPSGRRALDVGTNAGFDAFALARLGAEVLAVEPNHFIRQARFLEGVYGTGVDFREIGWQALDAERHGQFGVVHCGGLLLHEPAPLLLLLRLRELVAPDGRLVLGTLVVPGEAGQTRFLPDGMAGDPTWWWLPDDAALAGMLASAGFRIETRAEWGGGPEGTVYRLLSAVPEEPAEALLAAQLPRSEVPMRSAPGHYYSPMPDAGELLSEPRRSQIWSSPPREAPGIDWRGEEQERLCREVLASQERLALATEATEDPTEYFAANDQYPALDAWLLEGMLQHLRPARMIEVGSGFSSLVTARVNRERLGGAMDFTCIEPYPRGFLLEGVPGISALRVEKIQDTPLEVFDALGAGDVLFIDTSHTVKTGGDVPWLFGHVLPRLAPGVVVHVHDVFLPGDYPESWVREGWGWNEIYLVHAFLAFNAGFEVMAGAQYLFQHHPAALFAAFPGLHEHAARGGAALWLRRRAAG